MKTKFLTLLAIALLSTFAASAQAKIAETASVSAPTEIISFKSCFYLGEDYKQTYTMKATDFEALNKRQPICQDGLDTPTMAVSYGKSTKISSETLRMTETGLKAVGQRQNVAVKYTRRSADTVFLEITINDQPTRQIEVREDETGFVNAGLLDPEDKKSNAFLAFNVKIQP